MIRTRLCMSADGYVSTPDSMCSCSARTVRPGRPA
jgi:hypothetical protein